MSQYEITVRGKCVLVGLVVLIVGLSTFFAVRAIDFSDTDAPSTLSNGATSDDSEFDADDYDNDPTPAPTPPPTPTPSPLPEDINEPEYEDSDSPYYLDSDYDDSDPSSHYNEEAPHGSLTQGPVSYDPSSGALSFLFTPTLHSSIDDDTVSLIGSLLASLDNTSEYHIVVEFPIISGDGTDILLSAIEEAFALYNIDVRDLIFSTLQTHAGDQTFEVNIFFQDRTEGSSEAANEDSTEASSETVAETAAEASTEGSAAEEPIDPGPK